jgi:hypothetical protein
MPPRQKGPFPAAAADQPHVVVIVSQGEPADVVGPFPVQRVAKKWGRERVARDWEWLALPLTAPDRYVQRVRRN